MASGAAHERRNEGWKLWTKGASHRCNKFDPAGMVLNLIVSVGLLGAYPSHIQPANGHMGTENDARIYRLMHGTRSELDQGTIYVYA